MPDRPTPPQTPEGKIILRIEPPPEGEPELDEYGYVIADLKRVAAVAAAMFALLIGLSFLFR
ncbi:MAG: hypothetical protein JXA09_16720 [Anaerolineae bacterium]|nr:hypothetical protein [Anaerolineae bacterium]